MQAIISQLNDIARKRIRIVHATKIAANVISLLPANEALTQSYKNACERVKNEWIQASPQDRLQWGEVATSLSDCIRTFFFVPKGVESELSAILLENSVYTESVALCTHTLSFLPILEKYREDSTDALTGAELAARMLSLALCTTRGSTLKLHIQDIPRPSYSLEVEDRARKFPDGTHDCDRLSQSADQEHKIFSLLKIYSQTYVTKSRVHVKKGFERSEENLSPHDIFKASIAMTVCDTIPVNWLTLVFQQMSDCARMLSLRQVLCIGRCYWPHLLDERSKSLFWKTWSILLEHSRLLQYVHLLGPEDLLFLLDITTSMQQFYTTENKGTEYGRMTTTLINCLSQFELQPTEVCFLLLKAIGDDLHRPSISNSVFVEIQKKLSSIEDVSCAFTKELAVSLISYAGKQTDCRFRISPKILDACLTRLPAEKCTADVKGYVVLALLQQIGTQKFRDSLLHYLPANGSEIHTIISEQKKRELVQMYSLHRRFIDSATQLKLDSFIENLAT